VHPAHTCCRLHSQFDFRPFKSTQSFLARHHLFCFDVPCFNQNSVLQFQIGNCWDSLRMYEQTKPSLTRLYVLALWKMRFQKKHSPLIKPFHVSLNWCNARRWQSKVYCLKILNSLARQLLKHVPQHPSNYRRLLEHLNLQKVLLRVRFFEARQVLEQLLLFQVCKRDFSQTTFKKPHAESGPRSWLIFHYPYQHLLRLIWIYYWLLISLNIPRQCKWARI